MAFALSAPCRLPTRSVGEESNCARIGERLDAFRELLLLPLFCSLSLSLLASLAPPGPLLSLVASLLSIASPSTLVSHRPPPPFFQLHTVSRKSAAPAARRAAVRVSARYDKNRVASRDEQARGEGALFFSSPSGRRRLVVAPSGAGLRPGFPYPSCFCLRAPGAHHSAKLCASSEA